MKLNILNDKNTPQFDIGEKPIFKKYIPISEIDIKWGFTIKDLGHTIIPNNSTYPSKGHPGAYMFSWETGRVLNEYHIVLITEGNGVFESKSAGIRNIYEGDGFIIFPGEWHRYKPNNDTGWTEYWVGFTGPIADIILSTNFFKPEEPIISKCTNILTLRFFNSLFQLIYEEPFGCQRTASGVCIELIAELCNIQKATETNFQANTIVSKVKYLMHNKIDENIDFHQFCTNNSISYSKFRADFKKQTGFAPLQYFLRMKIEKAKDLLSSSDIQTKQIAYQLGFSTDHYFCRIFKSFTQQTPKEFKSSRILL
jgi:AraC-like DNA-binding protein